jgi:hypothetical protein
LAFEDLIPSFETPQKNAATPMKDENGEAG